MRTAGLIVIFLILTFTSNIVKGQSETLSLSLDQAIDYAMKNNKMLLNTQDEISLTEQKIKETIAQGLPQINGTLDYMSYFNYEMNLNFGSSSTAPDINYLVLDAGDLEVLKALGQMFGPTGPIIMSDQFSGKIQYTQLLFSGQYYAGIKLARIAKDMSLQKLKISELDVKENIKNTYYLILSTENTLKIIDDNLANLNDILKHTQNLYAAGVAEETDVDQIKITVSQMKNSRKALERINQLNYNMLKFQLGVSPSSEISLTDKLDLFTERAQMIQLQDYDVTGNINYQIMESQVLIHEKQLNLKNWAYAPTLSGFYSYTEKFKTTGFDMNPNNLVGVSLSVPIFSSGIRKSQVAQARINLDIAERNKEIVKDQLETQKKQLIFNYTNALENYETQKENVGVAERVYKSIENKYRQGVASSLDLSQANANYLNAQNNYFSSILTLLQSQTALDKLYNKL